MVSALLFFGVLMVAAALDSPAHAAGIYRASVATSGAPGDDASGQPAVSATGRYVAFSSSASDLIAGDMNGMSDVFVFDRVTGRNELVSVSTGGAQGNIGSDSPSISADGRYVAFSSGATNFVKGDTNRHTDIFVRDRLLHRTWRVSLTPGGAQSSGESSLPSLSANGRFVAFLLTVQTPSGGSAGAHIVVRDLRTGQGEYANLDAQGRRALGYGARVRLSATGRFVAFESDSPALVAPDRPGTRDVFVRDRLTGATTRVNRGLGGAAPTGESASLGGISADGRFVAFLSDADNLVAGDVNGRSDVFVFDRATKRTRLASRSSTGAQANNASLDRPDLSADGRFVAFTSNATNVVPGIGDGWQLYLRDLQAGTTALVSAAAGGAPANGFLNGHPSLSRHGRVVAFYSIADNLVADDTNEVEDVYVRVFPATP